MKLHLPVKLRASLIAAVIAVPAMLYNAFAQDVVGVDSHSRPGENYVAPSDAFGWDNNDIEFTGKQLETAGNTYTAESHVVYEMYDTVDKPVGLATITIKVDSGSVDADGNPILVEETKEVELLCTTNGTYYYEDPYNTATNVTPTSYKVAVDGSGNPISDTSRADIVIDTADQARVSYLAGNTEMTSEGVVIKNSVASADVNAGSAAAYAGNTNITTGALELDSENIKVVLEDTNLKTDSTVLSEDSALILLNGTGAADQFTTAEQGLLGITGTPVNVASDATNVDLGAVSGGGNVTVIGRGDDSMTVEADSVDIAGALSMGDTDATVANGVKAEHVNLVNSDTTVTDGDVIAKHFYVDADSKLEAENGQISNYTGGGSGSVNISGSVVATGDVYLDNGQADKGLGVKEDATVDAGGDLTLRNVDAVKAGQLTADGDITLVSNSTIEGLKNTDGKTDNISAGGDLTVGDGSSVTDAEISVGGSVMVSNDAPGMSVGTLDPSSITNTDITVTPTGTSTVTISGESSMTDSTIVGANGDITVSDDSKVTVSEKKNLIGENKDNLGTILDAAADNTPLTQDSLDELDIKSVIGNTAGDVTITDSNVDSSLITAGGDITIADKKDTPDAADAIAAAKDAIDAALANPDPDTGAITIPYTEINGEFGTVVDGSIIDVRNAQDTTDGKNDLTVDSAALTNSVILGVTGNISVKDSVLGNDYIDGGAGLDIDNSIIVDTDIVNMNADIVLKGGVTMISTQEDKPFMLTTKGTAEITDADVYTGGSIILDGTELTNGKIMSGVEVAADGTITYLEDTTTDVGVSATPGDAVDGSLVGDLAGVKLPFGQINVKGSTLTDMELYTAKGNISVDTSTVNTSNIAAAGAGSISITDSTVYDTDVTTKGDGNITITDSTVSVTEPTTLADTSTIERKQVTTGGAGNIDISGSTIAHIDVANSTVTPDSAGTIGITNSSVTDSSVLTGTGDISVKDSAISTSTVTSVGAGNISLTGTSATVPGATDASYADGAEKDGGDYAGIPLSSGLSAIGVPANAVTLNSITIVEKAKKDTPTTTLTGVYCQLVKGGTVVATAGPVDLTGVQDATATFDFAGVAIDPTATDYELKFVDENGNTREVRLVVNNSTGDPAPMGGAKGWDAIVTADYLASSWDATAEGWEPSNTVADSTISTGEGSISIKATAVDNSIVTTGAGDITITGSAIRNSEVTSTGEGDVRIETMSLVQESVVSTADGDVTIIGASKVLGSDVTTGDGSLTVNGSTVDSIKVAGTDADGNATETLDKSTLVATDDSLITESSTISGTDITISNTDGDTNTGGTPETPGLRINGESSVTGDVNMKVDGLVTVTGDSTLALDGDKEGEGARDASLTSDSLFLQHLAGNTASIINGRINVTTQTTIKDGNTFTLDNVNNAEGEAAGTLGDLLQQGDLDGDGDAWVEIKGSSIVEANRVGEIAYLSQTGATVDTADVTNTHNYFDKITVDDSSSLTVHGKALINTLKVNAVIMEEPTPEGSQVLFESDAYLTNVQVRGVGENTYLGTAQTGPEVTIMGEGHVGNLRMDNEGAISFMGEGKQSYIADIDSAINPLTHGVINVVGGELTTPVLNHGGYLSLGLNGGVVTLGAVSAEQGATIASTDAVNAKVYLDSITNASQTGAADVTPKDSILASGMSTIRTTVNRVEVPYSASEGTPTTTTATTYYYKVMSDTLAAAETTVQRYNATTETLETVTVAAGDKLLSGDIVAKTDKELTYFTKADGTQIANGYTEINAAELTAAEEAYLVRVTVPVVDENGDLRVEEIGKDGEPVLIVGQTVSVGDLTYNEGVSETPGTLTEMTDGIASLEVERNFDADNTIINAYETGSIKYMLNGQELDPATATQDELDAATQLVISDADTGFIKIHGQLTGQDNILNADNDIRINGIVADSDTADYENNNTLTSTRGDIVISGTPSIYGSANTLTALQGEIQTGNIEGNNNTLTAGEDITTANITGDNNTLTADEDITTANITGNYNTLDAEGNIVTANIELDHNDLIAGGSITTENITGSDNMLDAGDSIVAGTITGDNNALYSAGSTIETESVIGDSNVMQSEDSTTVTGTLSGDGNTITAGTTVDITEGIVAEDGSDDNYIQAADGDITIGATDGVSIKGSDNTLHALKGDVVLDGNIEGDANTINALDDADGNGGSISVADVVGSDNVLNAYDSITAGDITGSRNTLESGESIEAGTIAGDENELTAGTTIDVDAVEGDTNVLTAKDGDITIGGVVQGADNTISSEKQDVIIEGDLIGTDDAAANTVTAAGTVTIYGNVGGEGSNVTAYAQGLSQDDVAISVGTFNAQGTDLTIATTTSPVYGYASGNGCIEIGAMNAVAGDVDSSLVNNIISNNSYVLIGEMNGYNAYTNITAAKDVILGTNASTFATTAGGTEQSAANQSILGTNFIINDSVKNLTLTDSTVKVTNSISGTALTLTTTLDGPTNKVFESSAATVTLDSLTLEGNSILTANTVTLTDLTIDGQWATIAATNLTATGKLTLRNGAVFDINRVTVNELEIDNSTLNVNTLKGINELTLTNNSTGIITGGLKGMTGDITVENDSYLETTGVDIDGQLTVSGSSDANVSGNITADAGIGVSGASSLTGLNIITNGAITAEGGSTLTANGTLAGESLTANGSTVNAAGTTLNGGALTATDNATINSNVTGATDATITDSSVNGSIGMSGTLTATNATIGDVTGASGATLSDADTGSITLADGSNGKVEITNASLVQGNVANAGDATVTDSVITGSLDMNGALNATNAQIQGGITADSTVTSASVSGSVINSDLTSTGNVTASDSSITGDVSGADVELSDNTTAGTVTASGTATITNSTVGGVDAEGDVTASGAIINGTVHGANVQLSDNTTAGNVMASGKADITDSTVGSVDADGNVTASGAIINGTVDGADVELSDNTTAGDVTASGTATITDSQAGDVTASGMATITDSTVGSVDAEGNVTASGAIINGTVDGADVELSDNTTAGDVTASGTATITGSTVGSVDAEGNVTASGAIINGTVDGADVQLSDNTTAGDVTASGMATITDSTVGSVDAEGDVTASGATINGTVDGANVDLSDNTTAGDVTASGTATITGSEAGSVTASGNVTITNGETTGAVSSTTGSVTTSGSTIGGDVTAETTADLTNGSVNGSVAADDIVTEGTSIAGDVKADNAATLTGGSVGGSIEGTTVGTSGTEITGDVTGDSVTISGGSVGGSVEAETSATLTGTSVGVDVKVTGEDGQASIKDTVVTGDVTADYVSTENATIEGVLTINKGAGFVGGTVTEDVTVENGNVEGDGTVFEGDISADNATITGGTVAGDVTTDEDATITGAEIAGNVDAKGDATITGGTAGTITAGGDATITGGAEVSDVTATGNATIENATAGTVTGTDVTITDSTAGDVDATNATITGGTVGNVDADETASITGATAGTVAGKNVELSDATTEGVTADEAATITGGSVTGNVVAGTDATISGAEIAGDVDATGDATITGGTAGTITAGGDATITGGAEVSDVTATGDATIENATAGTVTGTDVTITESTAGDVDATNATITGGTVGNVDADETASIAGATAGTVAGKNVELSDATTEGVTADEAATITGGSVTGDVVAGTDATITGADISGNVGATDNATITGGTAGTITAGGDATITGGAEVADVTATGDATIENATAGTVTGTDVSITDSTAGDVDATNATITGGTVGNVDADETASITGATAGTVAGKDVTLSDATTEGVTADAAATITGGSVTGDVVAGTDATITGADISGNVDATDNATITGGTAGTVTAGGDATITGGAEVSDVTATGDATIENATAGKVTGTDVTITESSTGDVDATNATITGGTVGNVDADETASITGATAGTVAGKDVTITDGTADDVTAKGTASITEATVGDVTGDDVNVTKGSTDSITATGDVTLENAKTGDITATEGTVKADGTTDMGNVKAGAADVNGATADSLTTGDLAVGGAGFTADKDIAADGKVSIEGDTAADGSITLDGAEGSAITGADVTAGDKVTLDGTIDATDTTITGANGVDVSGTLNAGEGVALNGAVAGKGTINKTGGDTLELGSDTDMTGGKVNVKDSSLAADDGAKLGSVSLSGSDITVAGDKVGSVTVDSLTTDKDSKLKLDVELAGEDTKADSFGGNGKLDLNGAVVELDAVGDEASVADQTRKTLISGNIVSGANEDVAHSMDTLNAHIENTSEGVELVLSKNYKGAEGKTQNQSATADALASINPAGVAADSDLGKVLDALAHTRSEADAKAALDSLSGAGLTGLQKAITDDAKEHMQTLRSTMKALNADVQRRYDQNSQRIEGVQSTAISASATGGTSSMQSTDNCGEYTRNSIGGMVAMAHALYNGWTFGASFAFSYADAECGDVTMDGQFIYFDLAMMHKGQRLTQTGTIGAAFIGFDTERDVLVNAGGHSYSGKAEGSTNAVAVNMSYEMAYDLLKSDNGHRLGTVVLAEATFAQIDGMDEEGLGNAGVRAEFDDVASFTFGVGARYTYEFGSEKNPGYFNLDAMVVAEAGDNTPKVNNMFIGGGQTYELIGPDAGQIGLRLNAGLLLPINEQTGFFMNATSEFRSEQSNVGGSVGIKYSF